MTDNLKALLTDTLAALNAAADDQREYMGDQDEPSEYDEAKCQRTETAAEQVRAYLAASPAESTVQTALVAAERFIAGFEGDELQEGIDDLLALIRGAIMPADDLATASAGFTCTACDRPEHECSASPCAAVQADRES